MREEGEILPAEHPPDQLFLRRVQGKETGEDEPIGAGEPPAVDPVGGRPEAQGRGGKAGGLDRREEFF